MAQPPYFLCISRSRPSFDVNLLANLQLLTEANRSLVLCDHIDVRNSLHRQMARTRGSRHWSTIPADLLSSHDSHLGPDIAWSVSEITDRP